jgi:hypothetical protein
MASVASMALDQRPAGRDAGNHRSTWFSSTTCKPLPILETFGLQRFVKRRQQLRILSWCS